MSEQVQRALEHDRTVDITTIGRRSGEQQRIEIWFHNLDGHIYISGLPGRRGWYANVVAHPDFVFHLKETAQADIAARARPITDPSDRRCVMSGILAGLGREGELEDWIERSPLIELELVGRENAAYLWRPRRKAGDALVVVRAALRAVYGGTDVPVSEGKISERSSRGGGNPDVRTMTHRPNGRSCSRFADRYKDYSNHARLVPGHRRRGKLTLVTELRWLRGGNHFPAAVFL